MNLQNQTFKSCIMQRNPRKMALFGLSLTKKQGACISSDYVKKNAEK